MLFSGHALMMIRRRNELPSTPLHLYTSPVQGIKAEKKNCTKGPKTLPSVDPMSSFPILNPIHVVAIQNLFASLAGPGHPGFNVDTILV